MTVEVRFPPSDQSQAVVAGYLPGLDGLRAIALVARLPIGQLWTTIAAMAVLATPWRRVNAALLPEWNLTHHRLDTRLSGLFPGAGPACHHRLSAVAVPCPAGP